MLNKSLFFTIILCFLTTIGAIENKSSNSHNTILGNAGDPQDMPVGHYFTVEEFKNWIISNDRNAPYNKSTIKLKSRISNDNIIANPNARPNEGGISPLVLFSGGEVPSQASADINRTYAFNYWQYTDIMGYWGGGPGIAGLSVMLPTGSVVDAAHKNGVEIFGNIFFAPTTYGGKISWVEEFLEKDGESFPIADKMIEAAEYFGFDGWFINQETAGGNASVASDMIAFMKYFKSKTDLKLYWYDAMTESGSVTWQNELNTNNDKFFQDGETLVSDYMFLNFWWNNTTNLSNTKSYAKSLNRNEFKVYAGIDCAVKGYETSVDWDAIFPTGQEHNTSIGLYRPDDFLWYQPTSMEERLSREKRFWSGANGNPSNTITSHNWKGFANYVPANSVINEIPFTSNFSLGLGYDYFINGEKVSHPSRSLSGWNNIALQDILPTWRWWIESSGSNLNVNYDFNDAFYGGNSIKINGNLTSDNHIKLYKTKLEVQSDTKIDIAFKLGKAAQSNAKIGFAFEDKPSSFEFIEIGETTNENWNLKTLDLSQFSGKTIAAISIYFEANSESNYNFNLGRISIYNGSISSPSSPSELTVENKVNENDFVTLRLKWNHSSDNISHYNVYKKNQSGTKTYLGGTPSNYCFIPWIYKEKNDTTIIIEVEAIGQDMGVSEKIETDFIWYSVPEKAINPNPANESTNVYRNTNLIWTSGSNASTHTIYLGKSNNLVEFGTVIKNEFNPGLLDPNTTYYWKIDENNLLYTTPGEVWSFTTGSSVLDTSNNALNFDGVDDFINCGNDPSLQITGNEITLEAWINASSFKPEIWQGVILAKDQGGANADYGYMLRCGKDGRINFNVGNGKWNELNSKGNEIKLNNWHHIAAVMDGSYMRIYIDGDETVKKPLYSTSIKNASSANLLIGDSPAFSGRVFPGKIDEVRVWNIGRTEKQIKSTMNSKLSEDYYSAPDSGLVAYWNLDEGSGQVIFDLSRNGNNGILGSSNSTDKKDPSWVKSSSIVSVEKIKSNVIPDDFVLDQNYPNPFNPSTTISFSVPEAGHYQLKVFNMLGQEISNLLDENLAAGNYQVAFQSNQIASGIYIYNLKGRNINISKKMILLK